MMAKGGPGFSATLLGCFKDEAAAIGAKLSAKHGRKIAGRFVEYIGLSPRLYSLVWLSDCGEFRIEICKAKGIPSFTLKQGEGFEAYKQQLENPKDVDVTYHRLLKLRQKTSLEETTRRGVCAVDTKTYRVDDEHSLPLGHWRIQHAY